MYPEYLFNNDTQEIIHRVRELAQIDEPALRAHCVEVSRQTDTSSLTAKEDCAAKGRAARAALQAMASVLGELSGALSANAGIFDTRDSKADFSAVCRAIVQIEEERQSLLNCIAELTQVRQIIFLLVAQSNNILHFLSLARRAVGEDVREHYTQATALVESAYARLKELDVALLEVQNFCMTFIESHLSTFMKELRSAADFNHAGEALDRGVIRSLCNEALILINRAPNITF